MKPQSMGQAVLIGLALIYLASLYFMSSPVWMGFTINALIVAVVALAWNITGGFGGMASFGHAAMYGTGAYASAILQVQYGVNAWIAFAAGIVAGAAMGAFIGALAFPGDAERIDAAKIGILAGSAVAGALGAFILVGRGGHGGNRQLDRPGGAPESS